MGANYMSMAGTVLSGIAMPFAKAASMTASGVTSVAKTIHSNHLEKVDQKDRLAVAAYLFADSTKAEDLQKWMKKTFDSENAFDFIKGSKLRVNEESAEKHLNSLSRRERKILTELRGDVLRKDADRYFEEHKLIQNTALPKEAELKETDWKNNKLGSISAVFSNMSENAKVNRENRQSIQQEQTERLLAIAYRNAEGTSASAVRTWLNDSFENGEAALYVDKTQGLQVKLDDVKVALGKLDQDRKNTLIDAREKHHNRDTSSDFDRSYSIHIFS